MKRIKITKVVIDELDAALRKVHLMHARIGIALYSCGFNECMHSFKFFKAIMIYLYHVGIVYEDTILRAIQVVAKKNNIVYNQMKVKLCKGLKVVPRELLDPEHKYKKMRLVSQLKVLSEYIFEEILYELHPGYLLPICYKLD